MSIEIISEANDKVTNNVIEYLLANNIKFIRKNNEDFSNVSFLLDNNNAIKSNRVWHRRAKRNLIPKEINDSLFLNYLKKEEDPVNKAIEKIAIEINRGNYLGGYYEEEQHNKLYDLHLANRCGLKIPVTLVTTNKKDLLEFKKQHHKIITKAIKYPFFYKNSNEYYNCNGTFFVKQKDIDNLNAYFFVSVFQSYVEKKIEIRIFFFKNNYYPMAIFSQNDEKTKIDFRNYNTKKPNRCVPFKLPNEILQKLKKIMNYKKMSTGSIDLIVTPKNEFVFLEVNPQGQFHWLSESCNYYIEKNIAQDLS
jgi:ATP-GRASP peptide maturase of grasp-with-spasm system